MRLLDIKDGIVTVEIYVPVCEMLANICRDSTWAETHDTYHQQMLLGSFFQACAIAGESQSYLSVEEAQAVVRRFCDTV